MAPRDLGSPALAQIWESIRVRRVAQSLRSRGDSLVALHPQPHARTLGERLKMADLVQVTEIEKLAVLLRGERGEGLVA